MIVRIVTLVLFGIVSGHVLDRQSSFNNVLDLRPEFVGNGPQCSVSVSAREDCGQGSKSACEGKSCCWSPLLAPEHRGLPWCYYPAGQCTMLDMKRIDCHPDSGASQQNCEARGCCWRPAASGFPWCFYASDPAIGYSASPATPTPTGFTSTLSMRKASRWPRNVPTLKLDVRMETKTRLHFKISDHDNDRWEVPLPTPKVSTKATDTDYVFNYTQTPFSLTISRKSSGEVLFDTRGTQLTYSDQFIELTTKLPSDFLYGLGEHRGPFLRNVRGGQKLSFWSRDMPPRENFNLYGTHPFYLSLGQDGTAHGVFLLNSNAMDVILSPDQTLTYRTIGGVLDFYFFSGPTPDDVIKQYYDVIGKPAMPPFWSLGFHLCRWGYNNDEGMATVVSRMIEAGLPYDVQWNDIDYMRNKYDFTVDTTNFKNLPKLVDRLHTMGKKYMMIVDAGIPNVAGYKPYDEGLKLNTFIMKADKSGPIVGKVWPGTTVFTDFSHPDSSNFWYSQSKSLHDVLPYDGMWIDMDEPSNFFLGSEEGCPGNSSLDSPPYVPGFDSNLAQKTLCPSARHYLGPHYDLHNLYGYQEMIATNQALKKIRPGKRPFIVTRASFAGSGYYGFHWLGDNNADWANLKYSIAGVMNQNMYGFSMVGADICGFMGTTNEELCIRWMQLGAFYPFMRNHNTLGAPDQDPANPSFSDNGRTIMKMALMLRYSLLPHLYTLLYRSHTDGRPVARPLMFQYPSDASTYTVDEQFMWGDSLLISPVLKPDMVTVTAYIPEDIWYDYLSGTKVRLHGSVVLDAPLSTINVHIRGGSVVPSQQSGNSTHFSRQTPFTLTAALPVPGAKAVGELYWDDGDSQSESGNFTGNLLKFEAQQASSVMGGMTVKRANAMPYKCSMILDRIRVFGIPAKPDHVLVNGKSSNFVWDRYGSLHIISIGVDMYRGPISVVWRKA